MVFSCLAPPTCTQTPRADLILVNGDIRTLDPARPRAEALAASNGKIIAVGSSRQVRQLADERTRVIDAKGRLVLPGFNDAHVHFAAIGNKFSTIDLKTARTVDEILARFAEYARVLPKGRWILGGGFDPAIAQDGRLGAIVDSVTPENPVFVYSADAKSAFANGRALALAGLDVQTPDGRNPAAARRTGVLAGDDLRRVASIVPKDHLKNWPEVLETASNYAASLGVTSVQDMHSDELADVYRQLDRQGKLKTRVYDCSPISAVPRLAAEGVKGASGTAMVRTGCVKTFSDGEDEDIARLRREVTAADKAGLQVMAHAIGPRANAIVLDAFEFAAKTNGKRDRRFRVEHAHNAAESDIPRFRRSNIIASMQPWLFSPGGYPESRKLDSFHIPLAFGSDAPIAGFDPLLGIFTAADGVEDSIRANTIGSAFAEFQDRVKGSIAKGMLADFVIISGEVRDLRLSSAAGPRVQMTVTGGLVVYEREKQP